MTHSTKTSTSSSINMSNLSVRSLPSPNLIKRYRYSVMPSNDELNNKIDLEIRILDGILKLLNAISLKQPLNETIHHNNTLSPSQIDSNLMQILRACKCLFVSHRKLAIYMNSPLYESHLCLFTNNHPKKLSVECLRVPLAWKWNEYMRAQKNSENNSCKYAAFALVYVGNCIYDTELLPKIDATSTEISFKEKFLFDDVDANNFELKLEIYSYEIQNVSSNNLIIHSARKLAKQLHEFANKRSTNSFNRATNSGTSSSRSGTNLSFIQNQNDSSYAYSHHRFKLCAQATLTQLDLNDNIEARNLTLISDSNLENQMGLGLGQSCATLNHINTNTSNPSVTTTNMHSNRLPLFDHFCCRLTFK